MIGSYWILLNETLAIDPLLIHPDPPLKTILSKKRPFYEAKTQLIKEIVPCHVQFRLLLHQISFILHFGRCLAATKNWCWTTQDKIMWLKCWITDRKISKNWLWLWSQHGTLNYQKGTLCGCFDKVTKNIFGHYIIKCSLLYCFNYLSDIFNSLT